MKHHYAITIKVQFSVLAESEEEAERIATELCDIEDETPARARYDIEAYYTPNQSDNIKRDALNQE